MTFFIVILYEVVLYIKEKTSYMEEPQYCIIFLWIFDGLSLPPLSDTEWDRVSLTQRPTTAVATTRWPFTKKDTVLMFRHIWSFLFDFYDSILAMTPAIIQMK